MERVEQTKINLDDIFKEFGMDDEIENYKDLSNYRAEENSFPEELAVIQREVEIYKEVPYCEEGSSSPMATLNECGLREAESNEYEDISDYGSNQCEILAEAEEIQEEMDSFEDVSVTDDRSASEDVLDVRQGTRIPSISYGNNASPFILAQAILKKYMFRFLDSPGVGTLYEFNGRIWEPSSSEDMELLAYEELGEEDKKEQKSIKNFCRKVVDYIRYECMEKYEQGERFSEEDFKAVENRIVFQDCVYDAQTGQILPHDHHLPYYIEIDAHYTESDMPTPTYDKLKADATQNDRDSMQMFDRMLGYLMIPNRSGKCYFVMAHAKDSGKSILGHFIESIYSGERVKTINLEQLAERFSLSGATSKVLLSGLETGTDRLDRSVVAQIKRITGEDKMRVETKYKNEKSIKVRFKLLLATNGGMILGKNAKDNAFYRRTIVIPFLKSIPMKEIIADMPQRLQEEKSAILSKAARSLGQIIHPDGGIVFPESECSKSIKMSWEGALHFEQLFVDARLAYTGNPEDALPKEDIYECYQSYFREMTSDQKVNVSMCTKTDLMREIEEIYPGAESRKLRRATTKDPANNKVCPCMTGLQWKEEKKCSNLFRT